MRYNGIKDLISNDKSAKHYFDSLSHEMQEAMLAHGGGINTLEELKHFADVTATQG